MQVLRDKNRHGRMPSGVIDLPVHAVAGAEGSESRAKGIFGEIEIFEGELHAHEEQAELVVLVLVRVQDVGIVFEQKVGDGRDQAFAVRAIDEQDGSVGHERRLIFSTRSALGGEAGGSDDLAKPAVDEEGQEALSIFSLDSNQFAVTLCVIGVR